MKFSKKIILDFCKLSSISYSNQDKVIESFSNLRPFNKDDNRTVLYNCSKPELIESFDGSRNDCQVYINKYNYLKNDNTNTDVLSVCFRGTESYRDIITDLNMIKEDLDIIPDKHIDKKPKIHRGFLKQFLTIKEKVDYKIYDFVTKKRNYNDKYLLNEDIVLVFSGHSLGGGLATIASLYYSYIFPDANINCITFGSPRVGCSLFAQLFNERINNSFRYVNDNDPVPCVPSSLTYEHVKGLKWLNEDVVQNEIKVWRFWRFIKNTFLNIFGFGYNAINDHSITEYIKDITIIEE